MGILDVDIVKRFIRMCDDGFAQNWHERNGGNLTYRMKPEEVAECKEFFKTDREWVPMGVTAENMAGEYFISTGSGKYFRNVVLYPEESIGIVEINDKGDCMRVVWGLINGAKPTSEFPSHILNHSVKSAATDGKFRVIYHAHPENIVALTYVLPMTDKAFTRALWQSETECAVVFPEGVGVVPWMIPGSSDIAVATSKCMNDYSAVIWAYHGAFCAGTDFDETFGLMHTIEKAASIYVMARTMGIKQTLKDEDILAIADAFGVKVKEEFLGD